MELLLLSISIIILCFAIGIEYESRKLEGQEMAYLDWCGETFVASYGFSSSEQEILYQELKLNLEHQQ